MAQLDILNQARLFIGTPYSDLDCSNFVHDAYFKAGMDYPYQPTATFAEKTKDYFTEVSIPSAGDVVLFSGHMGLYDPKGCSAMVNDQACRRLKNDAPILSSQSGNNRGPEFGRTSFFKGTPRYFRWKSK
jgi:hypothetical protein